MTLQKFFNATTIYETRQAQAFQNHFALKKPLLKIPFTSGCAGDYAIPIEGASKKYTDMFRNRTIEFKSDRGSLYSRHFFVEFEQTCNSWDTCKPSGHVLAINEGHLLVVGVKEQFYCFDKESFELMLNSSDFDTRTTKRGKNGNKWGMHTRGFLVPVDAFKRFAKYIFVGEEMSS